MCKVSLGRECRRMNSLADSLDAENHRNGRLACGGLGIGSGMLQWAGGGAWGAEMCGRAWNNGVDKVSVELMGRQVKIGCQKDFKSKAIWSSCSKISNGKRGIGRVAVQLSRPAGLITGGGEPFPNLCPPLSGAAGRLAVLNSASGPGQTNQSAHQPIRLFPGTGGGSTRNLTRQLFQRCKLTFCFTLSLACSSPLRPGLLQRKTSS
jgi:hypothetical protein